jgi:geranylgeranyl diphosphate synthase, type II
VTAGVLEAVFPVELRAEVDRYLGALRFSSDPMTGGLEEAMRYSLLAGAKRVRPVLVLATARALGADHRSMLPLAAAIELIHTLSLIHDDLPAMDDDDMRRGQPSSHRAFGEGVAILAGDALFAEAFRLLLCGLDAPPERTLRAAGLVATALGTDGMAGGQYIDLTGTARTDAAMLHVYRLKTGSLIEASVRATIELAGRSDPVVVAALESYAAELGVLFQVVDDILDATGESGQRERLADECLVRIRRALRSAPCATSELLGIATFVRYRSS